MKRILLIAILAVAITSLVFGQMPGKKTTNTKPAAASKAEQEVFKTLDEVIRAMVEHDMPAIERLYTDNYVFSAPTGGSISRTQLIEVFKSMKANGTSYLAWEPSEMKISLYDDAAVTNCRFEIKTRNSKGEINTATHRYTCTWVKQQGRWRLAAAHASEIKPSTRTPQQ